MIGLVGCWPSTPRESAAAGPPKSRPFTSACPALSTRTLFRVCTYKAAADEPPVAFRVRLKRLSVGGYVLISPPHRFPISPGAQGFSLRGRDARLIHRCDRPRGVSAGRGAAGIAPSRNGAE